MRKSIFISSTIVIAVTISFVACQQSKTDTVALPEKADSATLVKRGEYLVTIGGCDDCHSPKRMGARGPELVPELRLSGYPGDRPLIPVNKEALKSGWVLFGPDQTYAVGPWGMSFAGNITSDATGIGNWSEDHFKTALRKGKMKGAEAARDMLPPMPWFNYAKMSDEDIKALYYYLKTTAPVKNVAPEPIAPNDLK